MKYYSEKLDKIFDTEEELKVAEKTAEYKALEKKKAAEARKAEAKVVEDAFKAANAAKREYNEKFSARSKTYSEELVKLKAAFDEDIAVYRAVLREAEENYDQELKKFIDAHESGYHLTLVDGDNTVVLDSNTGVRANDLFKVMFNDNWFDTFFDLFKI